MVIASGTLIPKLNKDYINEKTFFGIGFDVLGVPIDILPIYQLSCFIPDFSLLLVDTFLELNGLGKKKVDNSKKRLLATIGNLIEIYGIVPHIISCSKFMQSEGYLELFKSLKAEIINNQEISDLVLRTVPENRKHIESARDYPIHEFSCVKYFSNKNYSLKIGPSKEQTYDRIMQMLGFDINFGYILDAFALGTKSADKVIHYIPNSKGPNNGQRIFFDEEEYKIKNKLQQGCDEALKYFCKIASVSGYLLNQNYLTSEEISKIHGKKLKRETINLVFENIIKPYMGVKK